MSDPRIGDDRILVDALTRIKDSRYPTDPVDLRRIASIALSQWSGEADRAMTEILRHLHGVQRDDAYLSMAPFFMARDGVRCPECNAPAAGGPTVSRRGRTFCAVPWAKCTGGIPPNPCPMRTKP